MTETSFPAAILTDRLVGRQEQFQLIKAQIFGPGLGDDFRCVLVQALGGKGKTRLLREIEQIPVPPDRPSESAPAVVRLPLVDLADPALHTEVAFLRTVSRALHEQMPASHLRAQMLAFDEALAEYERARDNMAAFATIAKNRRRLREAFKQTYAMLTASVRVVWVLDTMEQIFATPDEIDALVGVELWASPSEVGPSTYGWLLDFIYSRPANTTMILAGRPYGPWVEKIVGAISLLDSIAHLPEEHGGDEVAAGAPMPPSIISLDLENFTVAEMEDYIADIRRQLTAPEQRHIADNLNALLHNGSQLEALYRLTEGNPIRLALYTDLLVSSAQLPDAFRLSLEQLLRRGPAELKHLREQIEIDLLSHIASQLGDEQSQVIEYLSVMRRGLDGSRLAALWAAERGEADEALHRVNQLSFVKRRSDGTLAERRGFRYFLHDELYQIYQEAFARATPAEQAERRHLQQDIFKRLLKLCHGELEGLNRDLLDLQHRQSGREQESDLNESLGQLRARRRQLLAEILHYALYLDPERGFTETYFDFAERALSSNDLELAGQLQSEINLFFFGAHPELNRIQADCPVERWDFLRFAVLHERVTNWLRRLDKATVQENIETFRGAAMRDHEFLVRKHYADLAPLYERTEGRLLRQLAVWEWEVVTCFSAILVAGTQVNAVLERVQELIGAFERVLRREPVAGLPTADEQLLPAGFRNRLANLLAQCYLYLGYGYVTQQYFLRAADYYQRAVAILQRIETPIIVLYAEVLNDLSRALGEVGAFNKAVFFCDEGARLNEQLGLDYRVAISYNTKALIYNLHQRPLAAAGFASRALILVRRLEDPRAIGLALIQAGEALRRHWATQAEQRTSGGYTPVEPDPNLWRQAETYLLEAETIFAPTGEAPENLRLIEAQAAIACLYRDLANYNNQQPGQEHFDLAAAYFDKVLALARPAPQSDGFRRQYLATLLDKAWLYKRARRLDEIRALEALAAATVPAELQLSPERPLDVETARRDIAFLRELSKLEALRSDIAELGKAGFARQLEHRILATVYLQLFDNNDFYLGLNVRRLYALVSETWRKDPEQRRQLLEEGERIARTYHLEALEAPALHPPVGRLQFRQVLADLLTPPADVDYL